VVKSGQFDVAVYSTSTSLRKQVVMANMLLQGRTKIDLETETSE